MTHEYSLINHRPLVGQLARLTAFNAIAEAAIVARWSLDTEYHRLSDSDPAYPRSTKDVQNGPGHDGADSCNFAIRKLSDDRLIGGIGIWIEQWAHREGWVGIGIGERDCWGNGYGTDAMRLLLRFAFTELNLWRVSLNVYDYNARALRSYEKAGFRLEGQTRGSGLRVGQRWNLVYMGILRDEWRSLNNEP